MENRNTCPVHVSLSLTVCAKMKQINGTHRTPYAMRKRQLYIYIVYLFIYGIQNSMLNDIKRSNAINSMQNIFWTGQKRTKSRTKCLCVNPFHSPHFNLVPKRYRYAVAQLVEARRYKPECRGFDSRWCHWKFFIDRIPPVALSPPGSTKPLTEMSTRNISWRVKAAGA